MAVSLSEMKQESASFWNTLNEIVPLMVMKPVRSPIEFAAIEKVTVPLPVPEPDVMVIQLSRVLADQMHDEVVPTLKLLTPPLSGKTWLIGLRE